ncbi:unnamed protein product [Didymodactylos carnosus]|uniref:Mab-21-like nucleotidyltransferase domain-containing protein n=1 Tax=Didymodactylos carnosus TaxID=1234261 RepID=A0A815UDX7_9BILA|nr:unnamed protein product [Didymodactylos carnosus]CAF4374706.1 unnamed protein product [Didymodactylos carnosus]
MLEIINSIPDLDFDFVPALELKFWPKNIEPFLNRLRQNRPDLYDKICKTCMYLVAKASPISSGNYKEFDFRYSFSAIELILAEGRTRNEKSLNSVAKSIYYKYLYKKTAFQGDREQYIPLYFVKTTIFWMCEQKHHELNKIEGTKDEEIEKKLVLEWIQYIIKLL